MQIANMKDENELKKYTESVSKNHKEVPGSNEGMY